MSATRNPARNNGKASKKKPGVSAKAYNGKTVGGYLPVTREARTAKRALLASTARDKKPQ